MRLLLAIVVHYTRSLVSSALFQHGPLASACSWAHT